MVALYADDAIHTSPKLRAAQRASGGRLVGKAALRQWWLDAFASPPRIQYELLTMTSSDHIAVIEYLRHRSGEPSLPVAEVFEIRDRKIIRSHVYHG
jgi:SnoaL-like domain